MLLCMSIHVESLKHYLRHPLELLVQVQWLERHCGRRTVHSVARRASFRTRGPALVLPLVATRPTTQPLLVHWRVMLSQRLRRQTCMPTTRMSCVLHGATCWCVGVAEAGLCSKTITLLPKLRWPHENWCVLLQRKLLEQARL